MTNAELIKLLSAIDGDYDIYIAENGNRCSGVRINTDFETITLLGNE